MSAGNLVLALPSSGVHSNGFSLVRRIVERSGLAWDAPAPLDPDRSLAEALLEPTRIYVRSCLKAIAAGGVTAFAHITGGGLIENPPRVYGNDLAMRFDLGSWRLPPVFRWLAATGGVEAREMLRTFNCGLGMLVVVEADRAGAVRDALTAAGETPVTVGVVEARTGDQVVFDGLSATWLA